MEVWKDIDDSYEASSYGRIKSKDRVIVRPYKDGFRIQHRKGKIKKLRPSMDGYLRVKLYGKYKSVSHLVATAFIPNPNGYTTVHHKDHNNQNNHIDNLEWISEEEHTRIHTSEREKKVYQYYLNGRLVKIWDSTNQCSEGGFSQAHISDCCLGKRMTHKGYLWSYELK